MAQARQPDGPKLARCAGLPDLPRPGGHGSVSCKDQGQEALRGLHGTNQLERLDKEVECRADLAGIFPGEALVIRLVGAGPLGQNDEGQTGRRYMQLEGVAELMTPAPKAEPVPIPPNAA